MFQYLIMILTKEPKNGFITTDKVLIRCDFNLSKKCKGTYIKNYRNVLKCKENNNGLDRCCYCFNTQTKSGQQNYNFKYDKISNYFSKIDSELKAYLLGWVAGDGSIKIDGLYFSIHPVDIEILFLIQKNISPDSPITYRQDDNTVNIKIHSVEIVDDLCKILKVKPGKKSHIISMPKINKKLIRHFLRGLFDSDGSIPDIFGLNTNPNINLSSTSFIIKKEISNLCNKLSINNCITETMIHFWGSNAIKFCDHLYLNSNFSLTRKRCLYKMWKTWIPFCGNAFRSRKVRDKSTYNLTGLSWYNDKFLHS